MPAPELDLATHYADNVAGLTLATNVFRGPVREVDGAGIPAKAVFCVESGGLPPQAFNGETVQLKRVFVDVRIRGDKDDGYSGAKSLADSVFDTTKYASISGYIDVRRQQSAPTYIGRDQDDHHEFTFSTLMVFAE